MDHDQLSAAVAVAGHALRAALPEHVAIMVIAVERVEHREAVPENTHVPAVFTNLSAEEAQFLLAMLAKARPVVSAYPEVDDARDELFPRSRRES